MRAASNCLGCGEATLEAIEEFNDLPRVTSDCKPFAAGGRLFACRRCGLIQKSPDDTWLAEIRRIYDGYEIYDLSAGAEQVVFTGAGAAVPRSKRLVEFVLQTLKPKSGGRLVDIGCGNGAALANFSAQLPDWELYGSEISDRGSARLRSLPGFKQLFTGPTSAISGKFDLVSMIHSLEHMTSPRMALEDASRLLANDGALFIEVPDIDGTPFDLLVADHLVHFSRATLAYLTGQLHIATSVLTNTVLPKEITFIGRRGRADLSQPDPAAGLATARSAVRWLRDVLEDARHVAADATSFGIFGTSVSGMWLYGALRERVSFFVDEDPSRVGREYEGRPILRPQDISPAARVYVPLVPEVARRIAERYREAPAEFIPVLHKRRAL